MLLIQNVLSKLFPIIALIGLFLVLATKLIIVVPVQALGDNTESAPALVAMR